MAPKTPEKQDPKAIVPWTTPDKGSPPQLRYYSGLTAVKGGSGQLSLFHILENDGNIIVHEPEVSEISDHEGGRKVWSHWENAARD